MNEPVYIYALCESDDPDVVRYIGQTAASPEERYAEHIRDARFLKSSTSPRLRWIAALRERGQRPVLRVLTKTDAAHAREVEKHYIVSHLASGAPLTNITHTPKASERPRYSITDRLWMFPLRLPQEWRQSLEEIADEMTTPTRRKPSLAEVVREAIYQMLVQRRKIDDRRK